MTKDQLIDLVKKNHDKQEEHYMQTGPNKHVQDSFCGVQMVQANYTMLVEYLMEVETSDGVYESVEDDFQLLPREEQREVWEASAFHYGIYGYEQRDADFFWHPDGWKTA